MEYKTGRWITAPDPPADVPSSGCTKMETNRKF